MLRKNSIWKKALSCVLAFAMLPQSSVALAAELAARALQPGEDLRIQWLPEKDTIQVGETGVIQLYAELDKGSDVVETATVTIELTREEAEPMTCYL